MDPSDMYPSDMDPSDVLALSARIKPMLEGWPPAIQGATLANLVSLFIAAHRPDLREDVLRAHIATVCEFIPASENEIFPNGKPEGWETQ